jgi:hypothetical protein
MRCLFRNWPFVKIILQDNPKMLKKSKTENNFLFEWVLFTTIGWWLGYFYILVALLFLIFVARFLGDYDSPVFIGIYFGLPFGLCIGAVQWLKLSDLQIHKSKWFLATSLGWGIFFAGSGFALDQYGMPPLLLAFCLVLTLAMGGFLIGALQFVALKAILSRPAKWILANTLGMLVLGLLTFGIYSLAYAFKSVFLKFFYSYDLYDMVAMRDYLLFGFLVIIVPVFSIFSIGIPTGKVLLKSVMRSNDS